MKNKGRAFSEVSANEYEAWYEKPKGKLVDILEKEVISKLCQVKKGDKVLEIGCGTGHFSEYFKQLGAEVTGLDTYPEMLKIAKDRLKNIEINFEAGDAYKLPFADNSFDLVAMITVLEFISKPERALAEAFRVSRGKVFLGILNRTSLLARKRKRSDKKVWQEAHFYTTEEVLELLGRDKKVKWKSVLIFPLINSEMLFNFRLNLERWISKFRLPFGAFVGITVEDGQK